MTRKIILSQGLDYDDNLKETFSWPPQILIALLQNHSDLLDYDDEAKGYDPIDGCNCVPSQNELKGCEIYYSNISNDYAIKFLNKFYFYNYDNLLGREEPELISLLENNPQLCYDADGNLIFRIIEIPDDFNFEIKRKDVKINNDFWIEREYLEEVLSNPRIFE